MRKKIKEIAINFMAGILFLSVLFGLYSLAQTDRNKVYQFTNSESYVVSRGETLWSIAESHSTDEHDTRKVVQIIKELTGKNDSSVQVNETLIIPLFDNMNWKYWEY